MRTTPKTPKKKTEQELFDSIETAIKMGNYVFMEHGEKSSKSRKHVNDLQVINLLTSQTKKHDEARDSCQEGRADWNYNMTGKTINNEIVRIVVSFEELMLIVLVTHLDEESP